MQQERGFNILVRSLEDNPTAFTYLDNLNLLCNHAIHLHFTLELELSAWTCKFGEFRTYIFAKISSSTQNNLRSLPSSQALNSLSKHKVVMLKVRYQGGNQVRVREFEFKSSRVWAHKQELKLSAFLSSLHTIHSLRYWPRACHSRSTWDPPEGHRSVVNPVRGWSSCVQSSSAKWTYMTSVSKWLLSTNEKVPFFKLSHAKENLHRRQATRNWKRFKLTFPTGAG